MTIFSIGFVMKISKQMFDYIFLIVSLSKDSSSKSTTYEANKPIDEIMYKLNK